MVISHSLRTLGGLALGLVTAGAHAAFVTTNFSAALWGASDSTLGLTGYVIEDFEDAVLADGLKISRLNGASGNFAASTALPANSVFDPLTDNDTDAANPANSIQAFRRGRWDGEQVLINHPGPASYHWYGDSGNWKDLQFDFAPGASSVGFSIAQMDLHGNQLLVNGILLSDDLLGLLGTDSETQFVTAGPFSFNSRHGYLRIDATAGDTIQTITFDNALGDGVAIDHLAFKIAPAPIPLPPALGLLVAGLLALRVRRRAR